MTRAEIIRDKYKMEKHIEGGAFSVVYTAPYKLNERPSAGSIYFLLEGQEFSCMHELDCDELWFYHEGCGLKITVLTAEGKNEILLGNDILNGEQHMAIIPKGCVFAANNLKKDGYTLVSCVTTPGFEYAGFRMIHQQEMEQRFHAVMDEIGHLIK